MALPHGPTHLDVISFTFMNQNPSSDVASSFPTISLFPHTQKALPAKLIRACWEGISYYPELKGVPITFEWATMKRATMAAQPRWDFFTKPRSQRAYLIKVSNNLHLNHKIRLDEAPYPVLLGWVVHELGHIMDYHRRSNFSLLRFILGYVSSGNYRRRAEYTADHFAMERNLGSYLLATKEFLLGHSRLSNKYKARLQKYYLPPEVIIAYLESEEGPLMRE